MDGSGTDELLNWYIERVVKLELYLARLRDATPHSNIKDEINELLNKD